jgi:hypothetical protein
MFVTFSSTNEYHSDVPECSPIFHHVYEYDGECVQQLRNHIGPIRFGLMYTHLYEFIQPCISRGSTVCIATGYALDD